MRVYKLSETKLPSGTLPYPNHSQCCVETNSYMNSYGGGIHSIRLDFNNKVIASRRDCLDIIPMSIVYEHPCEGCSEECRFDVHLGCPGDPCDTTPCEAAITCFCSELQCAGCGGGIKCCPVESESEAIASFILTSIHPASRFTINTNLFEDEYVETILSEATPYFLNNPIPVATAVTQNNTLEYYDPETVHVPTGDLPNDEFVGIALSGEMGLLDEDFRSCCDCPSYKPCRSVCVLSKGEIALSPIYKQNPLDITDPQIGFINDPTDPDNGRIVVFGDGLPPNVVFLPNAKLKRPETYQQQAIIEFH